MKALWALVKNKFSIFWKATRKFLTKKVVPVVGKVIPMGAKKKGLAAVGARIAKIFTLKRVLIALAVAAVVVAVCYGIGLGIGNGIGDGEGDGNSKTGTRQERVDPKDMEEVSEETEEVEQDKKEETEKDTEDIFKGAVLAVTVVGNDYFYANERVSLEELGLKLEAVEGALVVEVKDDNSSLRAYNGLLDKLDELNIHYIEK